MTTDTLPLPGLEPPAAAPEAPAVPRVPGTPGERLGFELAKFLPGFQVARVMVLAEEYAAGMIERHARRPGKAQG